MKPLRHSHLDLKQYGFARTSGLPLGYFVERTSVKRIVLGIMLGLLLMCVVVI